MDGLFLDVLNMSISASWLILAVIVIRAFMGKAPKGLRYVLWALVGLRLLCPLSIESALSMVPSAETFSEEIMYSDTPEIHSGVTAVDKVVNPILSAQVSGETITGDADVVVNTPPVQNVTGNLQGTDKVKQEENTIENAIHIATWVWLAGTAAMLIYSAVCYVRLKVTLRACMQKQDNLWVCDEIQTPFILGLVRPRIYMPSFIEENHTPYIVAHENEHLKYFDHWWKPLGFAILSLHWFNPLVWVAYILLCRDIELACDERVIQSMNAEEKKNYSKSLLLCSNVRHIISACPVAFGEIGVKERIKRIVNYKKPAVWATGLGIVVCVVIAICFMTNPKEDALTGGTEDTENEDFVRNEGVLSAEELRWFEEEFFNQEGSMRNLFLNSEYGSPEEIDLYKTFYAGMLDENRENPTQAEIDALIKKYGLSKDVAFVVKISRKSMDTALQKYMDITLAEDGGIGLDNFYYLEEYDAYYNIIMDVATPVVIIESGRRYQESNLVEIRYYDDPDYGGDGALYRVQLEDKNGNYYFVWNQKVSNIYENPISEGELEWFETEFFNNDEDSMPNMFLTSEYRNPVDVDLHALFYGGATGRSYQVSQEEKRLLEQQYDIEIELDVTKVTREEMDDILKTYTGLTREETNQVNLSNLYYLEKYDAFYNVAGDTMMSVYDFEGGWTNENGTITLQYRDALGSVEKIRQVTLRKVGGTWHFVSNVWVETTVNVDVNVDELTLMQKVLFNKAPYSLDCWIGEVDGIYWSGSNDDYWKYVNFFNVDLDRDGVDEVCVEYAPGLVLVFHEKRGEVYGHEFFYRTFKQVYKDGTFSGSSSASNTFFCGNVQFDGYIGESGGSYGYSYNYITSIGWDDSNGAVHYYKDVPPDSVGVADKEISKEEYDQIMSNYSMEEVERYDFTVENILKYVK